MPYGPDHRIAAAIDTRRRIWTSKLRGSKKRHEVEGKFSCLPNGVVRLLMVVEERIRYEENRKRSADAKTEQEIGDPDITRAIELYKKTRGKVVIVTVENKKRATQNYQSSEEYVIQPSSPQQAASIMMSGGLISTPPDRFVETLGSHAAFSQSPTLPSANPAPRPFQPFFESSNGEGSSSQATFTPHLQQSAPPFRYQTHSEPSIPPSRVSQEQNLHTTISEGGPSRPRPQAYDNVYEADPLGVSESRTKVYNNVQDFGSTSHNPQTRPHFASPQMQRQSTFDRLMGITPAETAEATLLFNSNNPWRNGTARTYLSNRAGAGSAFIAEMEGSIPRFEMG